MLVTGALGHIGSKLIRSLPQGFVEDVLILDDLSTQRYTSLFDLPKHVNYRFVQGDLCTVDLEQYLSGVEVVVHLAAITDAETSFDRPEEVERVNFEATQRIAEACVASGSKLIFLSTTSVYGPQSDTVDEDSGPEDLKPQSPYAESKLKAERLLEALGESAGLDFIICRFGTIFGSSPGMRFHTAINKFIWQACNGIPLTVWRTAIDQRRPYLYLGDAVAALTFIMENQIFDRRIYNVLTTNSTVREIVEVIGVKVHNVDVQCVDSPIMNQLSYIVSDDRFRSLGFTYSGTLEQGIGETVQLLAGITDTE